MRRGWWWRQAQSIHAEGIGSKAASWIINSPTEIHFEAGLPTRFPTLQGPGDQALLGPLQELRRVVKARLLDDIAGQGLDDPPLDMDWQRHDSPLLFEGQDGLGDNAVGGRVQDLAATFAGLSAGQRMAVVGPSGAGKTTAVSLVAAQILRDPSPWTVVPVIFPLGTWQVDRETLRQWMERNLRERYEVAAETVVARQLLDNRHLLPILDGLDEMAPQVIPFALGLISLSFTAEDHFIITSRIGELESAASRARTLPRVHLVARLEPVTPTAATSFITAGASTSAKAAWAKVAAAAAHPEHPLSGAMSRPLTIGLIRTAYRGDQLTPADLLDRTQFPDSATLEAALIEKLIPASLEQARYTGPGYRTPYRRLLSPDRCRSTLSFLAVSMAERGRCSFRWWELPTYLTVRERGRMASWAAAAPGVALTALMFPLLPLTGADSGTILMAAAFQVMIIGTAVIGARQRARQGSSVMDAFADVTYTPAAGQRYTPVPAAAATRLDVRRSIAAERRRSQRSMGIPTLVLLPALLLASQLLAPSKEVAWSKFLAMLLAATTWSSTRSALPTGIDIDRKTPWGPYFFARSWLACRGVVPLRLVSFLEQMRHAGLLRHVGAQIEFRSPVLQQALALRPSGPARTWTEPVSPLLLPGAADYTGEMREQILADVYSAQRRRAGLADMLAIASAALTVTAYGETEHKAAQKLSRARPDAPASSVISVFPLDGRPRSSLQDRVNELDAMAPDAAIRACDDLISQVRRKRRAGAMTAARLTFRRALAEVDLCQNHTDDLLQATGSLMQASNLMGSCVGPDHPETLTIVLVADVVDQLYIYGPRA